MAKVWIIEFTDVPLDARGDPVLAPKYPETARQTRLDVTSSSVQSEPFTGATNFVLLGTDVDCCISIGSNPVATQDDTPLFAKEKFFVGVSRGHKVAVIAMQ
jgi:hypothetical protein